MNKRLRVPVRVKIMVSLLLSLTLVVTVIVYFMANMFHDDKRAYIKDWVSVATLSTTDECRSLLEGYRQNLTLYSRIMVEEDAPQATKDNLLQSFFDSLPGLIRISVLRDGEELATAIDGDILESVGVSGDDLATALETTRPKELQPGQTYVSNVTLVEELPSFLLTFREPGAEVSIVVEAIIRSDELQRIASKFGMFEVLVIKDDGTIISHPDLDRVAQRESVQLVDEARAVWQRQSASLTVEFVENDTEMIGGFSSLDFGNLVVVATIPASVTRLATRNLLNRLTLVSLLLLVSLAAASLFWSRRITRPVERLSAATRTIAKGDFAVHVDVQSRDEIGSLASSFNQMASELHQRERALNAAQTQLIQSEKMAAFGQIGAGIAHEVKNPLAGILGCTQLTLMTKGDEHPDYQNLKIIERETNRCVEIIGNLMKFARQEETAFESLAVNDVVADASGIVSHQLGLNEIQLIKELDQELPSILGSANQLEQVLINLMVNAQQAMKEEPGSITVTTRQSGPECVEICVSDTGPGMTEEVRRQLFEPFFTTKPTGEGTGLGLSVSYGIVKDHGGTIEVDSEVGHGATFTLKIPVCPAEQEPAEALTS